MKHVFSALALVCLAHPAAAEDWKEEAVKEIATLQNVAEAMWSESGTLWLSTFQTDDDLRIYTEVAVCPQLAFAGKPAGEEILVSWFSAKAMAQNKLDRVATTWCP